MQDPTTTSWLKRELAKAFEIKDLEPAKYCLGIEFLQKKSGISISQNRYVDSVLERFGMQNAKPVLTPCDSGAKLLKNEGEHYKNEHGKVPYRELV